MAGYGWSTLTGQVYTLSTSSILLWHSPYTGGQPTSPTYSNAAFPSSQVHILIENSGFSPGPISSAATHRPARRQGCIHYSLNSFISFFVSYTSYLRVIQRLSEVGPVLYCALSQSLSRRPGPKRPGGSSSKASPSGDCPHPNLRSEHRP